MTNLPYCKHMGHEEQFDEAAVQKSDGERWLELLGYGHLKGQPTRYEIDGQPVPAEEFDRLCRSHVQPIFNALEKMDPNHPDPEYQAKYQQYIAVARKAFDGYFSPVTAVPE